MPQGRPGDAYANDEMEFYEKVEDLIKSLKAKLI
jgi:hypothetical protein